MQCWVYVYLILIHHVVGGVASQFVITFQFVVNYYKLERICNAIASQFVINYYKMGRNCITYAFQFVIIYYKLERFLQIGTQHGYKPLALSAVNNLSLLIISGQINYYEAKTVRKAAYYEYGVMYIYRNYCVYMVDY